MKAGGNLALAAGFLIIAGAARAGDGPVMRSLQGAAVAPMGATLEIQSNNVGTSFAGNQGVGVAPAASSPGRRDTPRLSSPASLSKSAKDVPAPPHCDAQARNLKIIRGVGLGAAAAGIGLFAFALATAATGPIGWAAALVFFGGMAAYLAHRRLNGNNDFKPA